MKYAITGGAGFIGSNIARLLVKNGHKVVIIDNLHSGSLTRLKDIEEKIEFHNIDIRSYNELMESMTDIDGIFHQAALTVVSESFEKPDEYYDVNVNGTRNIFNLAKKLQIKVIFASSSSVYGNVNKIPIKENFSLNPINPYGKTKVEKEILAKTFWNEGVKIIGLRYFNVYGIGQTGTYAGVITQFLKRLNSNLPPVIHGNGKQIRDFISVNDVAEANLKAMESNTNNGFFNIGTGKSISILELAKMMINISMKNLEFFFDDLLPGDIEISQADISLSSKKIDWEYKIELSQGLKELFQ